MRRIKPFFLAVLFSMFAAVAAHAGAGDWSAPCSGTTNCNPMMWGYDGGMMGYGMGWLFSLVWWAVIIVAIVALVRWLKEQPRGPQGGGKSALDILKERYAKGEIEKHEFEQKKKDLME